MATACPNRNSKEWKLLVSQTGETLADLAFVANNYQMPDVKTATEIKKAIGFKSKVDNTAGIANRLKIYNAKNNTSHYFTAKKIWGNTFELTLKYNYLPVNVEKQRQRMAAKQDPLYVTNDFDSKGFQQVYPGTVTPTQATLDFESDDLISPGVPELFKSNPELANSVYETLGFKKENNLPASIASTLYELEPNITDKKIKTIYDNYIGLMNKHREGKGASFNNFKKLLDKYQVYKYKDTYIFGQYDINTGTFITRMNSSPTSKELLAEAIPNIVQKGIDFISLVPKDYADKLVRSGYVSSTSSFKYDFKGEIMDKFAVASNANVFKKIFNKDSQKVTSEEIINFNENIELKYTPVEIKEDLINQAGKDLSKILETYLNQFGIRVDDINVIKEKMDIDEVGFADLLSKIAYVKDKKDLPPIAGEFIAYMMQYNPLVQSIINDLIQTNAILIPKDSYTLNEQGDKVYNYKSLDKTEFFKYIGKLISEDLENKLEGNYNKSLIQKIKDLIKTFFDYITKTEIDRINTNIGIISNNILQQNKKLITASLYKPGAFGQPTQQVDIETALKRDKFGASIIYSLAKEGFILTGSTALSEQGTILRPDENPLHDIDWVSPFNRKETEEKFLSVYPDAVKIRDIYGDGYITDSYLIAPDGYSVSNYKADNFNGKIVINSYDIVDKNGSVVGTYRLEKQENNNQMQEVVKGIEGKIIDFFSYENYSEFNENEAFSYTSKQGTVIKLSNWKDIFNAKLAFSRYKDIWDYNRFIPNQNINQITPQQKQQAQQQYSQYIDTIKSNVILPTDRIVFGHPTIGKSFLKNQGEDKFISLDDDYATEINNKVKEIANKYNVTTYQVKDGGTQNWNNEYNQMMQEMFNVAKQRAISENKTLFTSNTNLLRNNSESFDKIINLTDKEFQRRIQERGAKYDTKEWKSQINEAISKLPANKVINTDKYLSDLFLGSKQDVEGFKKFVEEDIFDEDYLLPSAPVQLKNVEQKRLNKINKEIVKERHNLNSVTDSKEYLKIIKRLENLRKLVDTAEGRVITSQNVEAFDDVINFGNLQLAEIKNLLNNPAVSYDDVYYAQRVLNLWIKAGDFSTPPEEHLFLDEDEFQTPDIKAEFRALRDVAEDLQEKLTTIKKDYVTNFVRNYTNNTLTKEQILQHMIDINKIAGSTLNLSRHDDAMLQSIFLAVEKANIEAQQEASEVWKDIDGLSEKFLKKAGNNYNILKQLTEDGKETGRLVHRFSSEFFEIRNRLLAQAFKERDKTTGALKKDKKKINAYFDWVNTNTISFDPRILFSDSGMDGGAMPEKFYYNRITFTEEQKAKHIAELKYHLGEKGYEFFLKRVEEKIEQFKMRREAIYDSIQLEPALSADEKDALFADWNKENSPFWAMDMAENPAVRVKSRDASGVETYYTPKGMREYIQQVPRKEIGGKATKWYDKNFQKIEADKDLLAYYDFTMSTLKKLRYMLPEQKRAVMGIGVLPTMEKSLMDIFAEKGVMMGVIPFWDKMKELQTTTDFSTVLTSDVDPYTGDIEKNIQLQYIEDSSGKIADMVKVMTVKYQQETGKPATHEDRLRFKKEAKDILSKEKSWDVTKILKAYSLTVLAYKHKSFIEPQIRLAQQAFNDRKELVVNKAGQPQEKDGQLATKEGLVNAKSALDFFLDTTMWNIGGRKVQGVTNKKLYTKKEEKQKKELEALIAKETDEETKKFLQTQLDALGGFRTLSGVGDTVLKFQTLKALGWNFISGASNLGFGIISNWIQAADGREYTQAQLRRAYMLSINSIGRNLSFNTFEGINGNAVKIRTLMDKWDLLKTSNKELFDLSNKQSYFKKLKRFSPFSIQERTEYLNQAPIMIAVLLNQKATAPDGSTVTLWDAYDINTGQLREGFETDVDEVKLVQKMKRIIEMNHGDYNNALQAKATIEGRFLTQFRTWMFEGFANRFESEKVDYALSYGMDEPYLRKGRYRSYSKGQLLTTGATLGTMFLPGIGTALGAGLGYAAGKLGLGLQTDDNVISDTLFTLKQLTRKLLFQKTGFEKKFTAVDAANMRKNMTELYIMVGLIGMGLFLKAMIADDDEEDEEKSNTAVFLLNQTIRLRTDISFYTNPLEFEKLTKMAVPAASLIADVKTFVSDVGILFNEDEEDDVFESGPFKGVPKWYIHGGQLVPFAAQGIKSYKMGQRVLD